MGLMHIVQFSVILVSATILYEQSNEATAESPSFVRQIITDLPGDWSFVKTPQDTVIVNGSDGKEYAIQIAKSVTECSPEQYRFPDIAAVSYFSNGKALNATVWLHNSYSEPPLNLNASSWLSPPIKDVPWYRMFYGMSIGINSAYDADGSDYQVRYLWDIYDKNWTRIVEEMSPLNDRKPLDQKPNFTGFSHREKGYVDLSLDLESVTYPNQYNVLFYTMYVFIKDGHFCGLSDISNRVYIPPPEFTMIASPNPVELRVGEEKTIELHVKSKTNLKSYAFLSTSQIEGIEANFSSNRAYVPPDSSATLALRLIASENQKAYQYTLPHSFAIPIFANLSIPTESRVRGTSISDGVIKNPTNANTTQSSNLTVNVLPALTIPEHLNNIYKSWLLPISGIWTFLAVVAAVVAPVIVRRFKKNRSKNRSKKR